MDDLVLLYVTCADGDEAKAIAHTLVDERLAACANILGPMTSVYRWEGAIQEDGETLMILKTVASKIERLQERIGELHPYDLPEILVLNVCGGSPAYLSWVERETA